MLAITGAGDLAGAIAQRVASRGLFREIRLIDDAAGPAAGKALDITQAGPVDSYDTRVTGHAALHAAAGARVIVVADRFAGDEWKDDAGLAMIRQLLPAIGEAPLVFAGSSQTWLMEAVHRELKVPAHRLTGSAPLALESTLVALAGLALDLSPAEISLRAYGRPPREIAIGWSSGVAAGAPIEDRLPPHERLAITERVKGLWPPGPTALGSAAARVVQAFAEGTRRQLTCYALNARGRAAAVPVGIDRGRVVKVHRPALSAREQVEFDNAIAD